MYHSTLGLRVIKKEKKKDQSTVVGRSGRRPERVFFVDNLLVRIHFIIVMIRRTGLVPWEFEFPFPGSLTSTFLGPSPILQAVPLSSEHGTHKTVKARC